MHGEYIHTITVMNPYPAKVNSNNVQSLKVVSRYRDPQLQVTYICSILAHIFENLDVQPLIPFPITVIWSTNEKG